MMIDPLFAQDHFPWLAKLVGNAREVIYQFAMFGMTTQQVINSKAIMTAVVIGVLSSLATTYANSATMANQISTLSKQFDAWQQQYAKDQEYNRTRAEQMLREAVTDRQNISDRALALEIQMCSVHPNTCRVVGGKK
jgi:uncharacterized protein (UPF0332 family)